MKPQDVAVMLKIAMSDNLPIKRLSDSLRISVGEVNNSLNRLEFANLVLRTRRERMAQIENIKEFLFHGLKYTFPAQIGKPSRGFATAWGHPKVAEKIASRETPVWSHVDGDIHGPEVKPLYQDLPDACAVDAKLYEVMALVDCLRLGRSREVSLAQKKLAVILKKGTKT